MLHDFLLKVNSVMRSNYLLRWLNLLESNQRCRLLSAILTACTDGLFYFEPDNKLRPVSNFQCRFANESGAKFVGQSPANLTTQDLDHHLRPLYSFTDCCRQVLETGASFEQQIFYPDTNSWFHSTLRPIPPFGILLILRQITDIKYHTDHDTLTGLLNRSGLDTLKLLRRQFVGLMFVDLDYFKKVNDLQGDTAGNWLLKQVAGRLSALAQPDDEVIRFGGDEFGVLLSDTTADELLKRAGAIVESLKHSFQMGAFQTSINASIGVAKQGTIDTMMQQANIAMLQRKSDRSLPNVILFHPEMLVKIQREQLLLEEMAGAIERQEFVLWYQPIFSIQSQPWTAHNCEALIRWQHPRLGLLGAGDFIPIAEQHGLISPICEWVFSTASAQALKWGRIRVHVNLSTHNLRHASYLALIENYLTLHPEGKDLIIFEVTEGIFRESAEEVLKYLNQIKNLGFQLEIDDFGSGYSGLARLSDLPISAIKLDRSLTNGGKRQQAICASSISLAHRLGLVVVAEGLETRARTLIMEALGCDFAQGFCLSRPLAVENFEAAILN